MSNCSRTVRVALFFAGVSSAFCQSAALFTPYCMEQVTVEEQTLADGTHLTRTRDIVKTCRDAEGRTRTERSIVLPGASTPTPNALIEIADPIANYRYLVNEHAHTARRWPLNPSVGPSPNPNQSQSTASSPANTEWFARTEAPAEPRTAKKDNGKTRPEVS